jgi:hypothetical protein
VWNVHASRLREGVLSPALVEACHERQNEDRAEACLVIGLAWQVERDEPARKREIDRETEDGTDHGPKRADKEDVWIAAVEFEPKWRLLIRWSTLTTAPTAPAATAPKNVRSPKTCQKRPLTTPQRRRHECHASEVDHLCLPVGGSPVVRLDTHEASPLLG